MRQTIFREGVIETLPSLIGNYESTFSVQSSMLENFQRVCKALLGNSSSGKIMSGLTAVMDGADLKIESGYGITKSGKLITVMAQIIKEGAGVGKVYLRSVDIDRGDAVGSTYMGGRTSWINREATQQPIIKDSLGARATDTGTSDIVSIAPTSGTEDMLYLGDISGTTTKVFVAATSADESVEYKITPQINISSMCNTSDFITSIGDDSLAILPEGRKRLKQINMYVPAMTSTARTGVSYDLTIYGKIAGSSPIGLGTMSWSDLSNPQYVSADIDAIMNNNMIGVFFTGAVTGTTVISSHTTPTRVEYIIEKLN